MGKTKTAFVAGVEEKLSGKELYEKRKKAKEEKATKVHIPGLKGGQRVVAVQSDLPPESELHSEQTSGNEEAKKRKTRLKVRSKKYKDSKSKVDPARLYKLDDAVALLKEISYSKFDSTVELHLVVRKDNLSANITLPHSTGKVKRVEVAGDETIKKLKDGRIDFDVLLATGDMMPKLVPFAKLLGPRGLMPNPKNWTLIKNEKEISKFSANSITLKTEKSAPIIHTTVGKLSMQKKELDENITAILETLTSKQIIKAYICSTMSPSVKLALS